MIWTLLTTLTVGANPEPLVHVQTVIPDVVVELAYATPSNFMGAAIYPPYASCLLLERVAHQLSKAAAEMRARGFRLKLLDCYRPARYQRLLWKVKPVPGFVADPRRGSQHSRGAALDLSLVTLEGEDVPMPSAFDAFGPSAHGDFAGGNEASRRHRNLLRAAMERVGFRQNAKEWWHFSLPMHPVPPLRDEPFRAPNSTR